MGKNEKTPITINEKEYFVEDLTDEQKKMFNHLADLNRKLASSAFNMDQLRVGRDAFINMLAASVQGEDEVEEAEIVED